MRSNLRRFVFLFFAAAIVACGNKDTSRRGSPSQSPTSPTSPSPASLALNFKLGDPWDTSYVGARTLGIGLTAPEFRGDYSEAFTPWVDGSGNRWFYAYGKMWKLDAATTQWTWASGSQASPYVAPNYGSLGVPSSTNHPGYRWEFASWTDNSGNFWLFGGTSINPGTGTGVKLNDLWKYNSATMLWTWVGGSTAMNDSGVGGVLGTASTSYLPSARSRPVAWKDFSGFLWLYGGSGSAFPYTDLWKLEPSTLKWTRVRGAANSMDSTSYGTLGVTHANNNPGIRGTGTAVWEDGSGKFLFFGGAGQDSTGQYGSLNDLWSFDPTTTNWTWIGGTNLKDDAGNRGALGVASTSYLPSGRYDTTWWIDSNNDLWIFGGRTFGYNTFNDLWKYETTTGKWSWVSGATTQDDLGVYGDYGVASTSYLPRARSAGAAWTDSSNNLWLWSGRFDASSFGYDLWKFETLNNKWTVYSGGNTFYKPAVYGTKGVAAGTNNPGGRHGAFVFSSKNNSMYLFGGNGITGDGNGGYLNDLWKLDATTSQWTWVSGSKSRSQTGVYGTINVAAPSNMPGSRTYGASWRDSSGNLWIYGGYGYDSVGNNGILGDLWMYDVASGNWTWKNGSEFRTQAPNYGTLGVPHANNYPGSRADAYTWTDSSGNLWLFGGYDDQWSNRNDLWKYQVSTGLWTWMGGTNQQDQSGVYGTIKVGSTSNIPGARYGGTSWVDSSNNFWLFGGCGYDSVNNWECLNDLWKYSPTTQEWTWVSGVDSGTPSASYGTVGVSSSSNTPGGRYYASGWVDNGGTLWMLGGQGNDAVGWRTMNDIWKFNTSTQQWTWVAGNSSADETSSFTAPLRIGDREAAAAWTDGNGKLWLFGGSGSTANQNGNFYLNDLWIVAQ